mgnify:FL=1
MKMSASEKRRHDRYLMDLASEKDIIDNAKQEGLEKGEKIGLEKGEKIGLEKGKVLANRQVILEGRKIGLSISILATMTGLTETAIKEIIKSL